MLFEVKATIADVVDGYNVTVFAYGATGKIDQLN